MDLIATGPTVGRQVHNTNVVAVGRPSGDGGRHGQPATLCQFAHLIAVEELRGTI